MGEPVILIRPVEPGDREAWQALWEGYLAFYKAALSPDITQSTWARLHDPSEPVHGLVAVLNGDVVGIVHYLFHLSTWTKGSYCYLEDLYASDKARNRGIGRHLIEAVADRAREAGAARLYWNTHETNETARALYDKVAVRSGFLQYRLPV
ncbi:GNAT family N-acetyltransferase [Microvirga antarctica]|uniref:GNAT family N-acetyltransferase n=1 Tax=Microvirga antarctica TaxID=2819233 RepID=UPI001B308E87|nr:GNAT family N-acetyltransferase [Microvirga antarctica]